MRTVDLNCDLGEDPAEVARDESLLALVTSINVACGGHAGDQESMRHMARAARQAGVALGAHPGYPDRAHFGRHELEMSDQEIAASVTAQVQALSVIAREENVPLVHVKPHGALYNRAARDSRVAIAIGYGVAAVDRSLRMVGLAGSLAPGAWREQGLPTAAEGFADRRYEADGTLRARRFADALVSDPAAAAEQAVSLVRDRAVDTVCVHSDTPGAIAILIAVRAALSIAGVTLAPPGAGRRIMSR
jgi:UPF0271 protein